MNLGSSDEKIIMHIRHIRFDKKGDKNCLKNLKKLFTSSIIMLKRDTQSKVLYHLSYLGWQ